MPLSFVARFWCSGEGDMGSVGRYLPNILGFLFVIVVSLFLIQDWCCWITWNYIAKR